MHKIAIIKRFQRDQEILNFILPDLTIPPEIVESILKADIKRIKDMLYDK